MEMYLQARHPYGRKPALHGSSSSENQQEILMFNVSRRTRKLVLEGIRCTLL